MNVIVRLFLPIIILPFISCDTTQKISNATVVQAAEIQLASPKPRYSSSLFSEKMNLQLVLDQPGAAIYYTTDGSMPTASSKLYTNDITVQESSKISAIATHPQLQHSEVISVEFIKANKISSIQSVTLSREPSDRYQGNGANSLFDLQKGTDNFSDGQWMGYNGGELTIDVKLASVQDINSIKVSTLSNPGAWICLPEQIKVAVGDEVYDVTTEMPDEAPPASQQYINIPIKKTQTDRFSVHLSAVNSLPAWHQGSGSPAWMFIDEILID